ncbi:hypothetical protein JAAARDRAFT_338048 [Jaapia argillacea MUCL 33604]|uniref:Uncharacterized protein n=1 Tax=Jaapia argillacea MUCL 33604 TaxID=933084 RepID=A0A067PKS9_9AGAM|nr:hypothetical protein JAAARDRAFT_338048 [Jaapia argillacea MUCL 33604]
MPVDSSDLLFKVINLSPRIKPSTSNNEQPYQHITHQPVPTPPHPAHSSEQPSEISKRIFLRLLLLLTTTCRRSSTHRRRSRPHTHPSPTHPRLCLLT